METTIIRGPYVPTLIDDGTLDTVIQVEGPNLTKQYRFNYNYQSDENEKYEEFVKRVMKQAIYQHRGID